ncbi:uncharacterized protein LOC111288985 [Durio zibethinus]|uniref:Uncharacterized protein LOC111288985 n=1 Tax=Durio zibethinus TaxID=66656 RepID=A0A6P5Y6K3_DURZI|nr:uncharacterized protein LOC111288985 [Durio zibethinus]
MRTPKSTTLANHLLQCLGLDVSITVYKRALGVSQKGLSLLQKTKIEKTLILLNNVWFKIGYECIELRNMDTDDTQIMLKEKLEFLDILKEALTIPHQHFNFVIFSLFTSLPYFFLSVFFEIVLQETLLYIFNFNFFAPTLDYLDYDLRSSITLRVDWHRWIKLCLLYLVPCHLLGLLNIVMTVNAVSIIYAGEKPISLRNMTVKKTRLKGPFITSIYVLLLSTCILLGLVGVVTNCYILTKGSVLNYYYYGPNNYFVNSSITIFHVAVFIALLVKYAEWSAGWNMALVISVLEETYGIEAFELSAYFSRGSTQRGLLLMLVFVVWEIVFRLPCFFERYSERLGGILFSSVCTGLICIGNLMKWVVSVVYFFDCKKRILEKKVDEEVGRYHSIFGKCLQCSSGKVALEQLASKTMGSQIFGLVYHITIIISVVIVL